jgi:hypothetical protein
MWVRVGILVIQQPYPKCISYGYTITSTLWEDPVPPYAPAEPETGNIFTTSSLQVSLEDSAGDSGVQPQALTPASVTASIPSSEAVSAASSAPEPAATRRRKSTVAARRSRNYLGPRTQPGSSSSSSHSRPPFSRRSPSPRHHSPSRYASSRRYSPPSRQSYRRSPSPGRSQVRRRSPSPPFGSYPGRSLPGAPGVRIIQTREQHRIIQDTDTGISALVPVMQVSSVQMGLNLSALMQPVNPENPRGRISPGNHSPPRSIEGSRGSSRSYYPPRSRSPRREFRSRQRSPSPRRSDYESSRYSSQSGSRRSPTRQWETSRRRNPRTFTARAPGNEPVRQDPQEIWGETTSGPDQGWGNPTPPTPPFSTPELNPTGAPSPVATPVVAPVASLTVAPTVAPAIPSSVSSAVVAGPSSAQVLDTPGAGPSGAS